MIMEIPNQFVLETWAPAVLAQYQKFFLLQLVGRLLQIELAIILTIFQPLILYFFKLVHPPGPFLIVLSPLFQIKGVEICLVFLGEQVRTIVLEVKFLWTIHFLPLILIWTWAFKILRLVNNTIHKCIIFIHFYLSIFAAFY